jgi:hypothetical protein
MFFSLLRLSSHHPTSDIVLLGGFPFSHPGEIIQLIKYSYRFRFYDYHFKVNHLIIKTICYEKIMGICFRLFIISIL